jgi:hypothetical protein
MQSVVNVQGRDYINAGSPRRADVDHLRRLCVSAGPVRVQSHVYRQICSQSFGVRYHGAWREAEGYISA